MSKPKILFFIQSSRPTNHERQVAMYANGAVFFRNANLIKPDDHAEHADAVMGAPVPSQYADYPRLNP